MIIFLAPHLEFPTRNGGDIYTEKLSLHLSSYKTVILLATNRQVTYKNGSIAEVIYFQNKLRSKVWAALRTILFVSHYLAERFNTPIYQKKAKLLLLQYPKARTLCSMLSTSECIKELLPYSKIAILTQNDEILWFQNQRHFSKNIFHKIVAWISENWVKRFLKNEEKKHLFIHITQTDYEGFKVAAPNHKGIVVPAGVDISDLSPKKITDGVTRLVFVGTLSVKTNYDALLFFKNRFWPTLKEKFKTKIEFQIAGSNPTKSIYELAQEQGWQVFANLEDAELKAVYECASFSVLSFPYTTGAKLKLLNSLAVGLPVLATKNMLSSPEQNFQPNCYSDSPKEWVDHLSKYIEQGISEQDRQICQKYANQFSWQKIVEEFEKTLTELGF
jgi:glycosyltransferase involved in cell wall biosynthesis